MPTPDICDLILEQHREFRARFAELDDLRDADAETVERARALDPGSDEWWRTVGAAREENGKHTAEEERGALADVRRNAPDRLREEIGAAWLAWHGEHARDHDREEKDVVDYVEEHGDGGQVEAAQDMAVD